jgi:hypothetical protein
MKLKLPIGVTGFWNDEKPSRFIATGSQMGRQNIFPDDKTAKCKLHLRRLKLTGAGCYDSGGAYWGRGKQSVWIAFTEHHVYSPVKSAMELFPSDIQMFFRADNRGQAKQIVQQTLPNAKFYN